MITLIESPKYQFISYIFRENPIIRDILSNKYKSPG